MLEALLATALPGYLKSISEEEKPMVVKHSDAVQKELLKQQLQKINQIAEDDPMAVPMNSTKWYMDEHGYYNMQPPEPEEPFQSVGNVPDLSVGDSFQKKKLLWGIGPGGTLITGSEAEAMADKIINAPKKKYINKKGDYVTWGMDPGSPDGDQTVTASFDELGEYVYTVGPPDKNSELHKIAMQVDAALEKEADSSTFEVGFFFAKKAFVFNGMLVTTGETLEGKFSLHEIKLYDLQYLHP